MKGSDLLAYLRDKEMVRLVPSGGAIVVSSDDSKLHEVERGLVPSGGAIVVSSDVFRGDEPDAEDEVPSGGAEVVDPVVLVPSGGAIVESSD